MSDLLGEGKIVQLVNMNLFLIKYLLQVLRINKDPDIAGSGALISRVEMYKDLTYSHDVFRFI
jgi:hypothetical protein